MSISAMGPWPWPRLIMCSRSPGVQPCFSANRCSIAVGSAPVDRMNTTGVWLDVSGNTSSSVHGAGSVNSLPSRCSTYLLHAKMSFSSRNTLTMHSFANEPDSLGSQPAGSGARCGSSLAAHASHAALLPSRLPTRPASCGTVASAYTSARHADSLTQDWQASGRATLEMPVGPRTRKLHSGPPISPLDSSRKIEVHTRNE
mmetsp:Transcript_5793/g.17701  ORF Transcript_5793/g.17701 Transcript_5793/m.17701 type:complete len:201 (+) Transcript_5793:392-994(+)